MFKKYESCVLHIPHSSKYIPNYDEYVNKDLLLKQIDILTDHFTDDLFDLANINIGRVVFPYNRFYCDVERFWNDKDEVMSKYGHGAIYKNTCNGTTLRKFWDENKIKNVYDLHHVTMKNITSEMLENHKNCLIIDSHSFNPIPLAMDLNKQYNRPDFCVGFNKNSINRPSNEILNHVENFLTNQGYSVEFNKPFSGSYIPNDFITNKNVNSIMIEVNRKLYLDENYQKAIIIPQSKFYLRILFQLLLIYNILN